MPEGRQSVVTPSKRQNPRDISPACSITKSGRAKLCLHNRRAFAAAGSISDRDVYVDVRTKREGRSRKEQPIFFVSVTGRR